MQELNATQFVAKLGKALVRVGEILHAEKTPEFATDVQHLYTDKFRLAEFLTQTAATSVLLTLEKLGLDAKKLSTVSEWSKTHGVTLRFKAEETCTFLHQKKEKIKSPTSTETTISAGVFDAMVAKFTSSVTTTVIRYYWKRTVKYSLVVAPVTQWEKELVLRSETNSITTCTSSDVPPAPKIVVQPHVDLHLNWLMDHTKTTVEEEDHTFTINRNTESCRTPVYNDDISQAQTFFTRLYSFHKALHDYFRVQVFPLHVDHGYNVDACLTESTVFVPVLPLFVDEEEEPEGKTAVEAVAVVSEETKADFMTREKIQKLHAQHETELNAQLRTLAKTFVILPVAEAKSSRSSDEDPGLVTVLSCALVFLQSHGGRICTLYLRAIEYIDNMIRDQLIAAIGKEVSVADFNEYMVYHNRKLLQAPYRPKPFCHSIRRPDHAPEGLVSITQSLHANDASAVAQPVTTQVFQNPYDQPMSFAINAATKVRFTGAQYLHTWMNTQFSRSLGADFHLSARARQFSSFILVLGRIVSPTEFDAKHAIIIQNRDDLQIPILLEHLPTPKEFRDAIESLSPEQQRFAKAYRGMQLESTMFGICVIQIKPALETVLKLPVNSLTKERKLTQELLQLFIEYQISSDLLGYDGPAEKGSQHKVEAVRQQVSALLEEIRGEQKSQIERKQREVEIQQAQMLAVLRAQQQQQQQQQLLSSSLDEGMNRKLDNPKKKRRTRKKMMKKSASSGRGGRRGGSPATATAPVTLAAPAPAPVSVPVPVVVTSAVEVKVQQPVVEAPEQQQQQKEQQQETSEEDMLDYTKIPVLMDSTFEAVDSDNCMKAAILKLDATWSLKHASSLLEEPKACTLDVAAQTKARDAAFDLLDALSRSGDLPMEHSELHVVIPVTHVFTDSVINTVVRQNVNPIEKVERSVLIMASITQQKPVKSLVLEQHHTRLLEYSPSLFLEGTPLLQ